MTNRPGGFGGEGAGGQPKGEVIQRGVVSTLRFLQPKHFEAPTGDALVEIVRAWQIQSTDPDDQDTVDSEERELVDWDYTIDVNGIHHIWIWYAE